MPVAELSKLSSVQVMSPVAVFEEPGFSGSLSGLSKQKAAHVDPGVTCNAFPYGRKENDDSSKITYGVILREPQWEGLG